jgi:IS605 OrfB family transposase
MKIYPTPEQANVLDKWFEIYRLVYNTALKYVKTNGLIGKLTLRTVIRNSLSNEINQWIDKVGIPLHTVNNAIIDVHKAYKSAIALARVTHRPFRIRYKKTNCNKSLSLEQSAFSNDGFAVRTLGKMRSNEIKFGSIKHDVRLVKKSTGYYLSIPEDKPIYKNTKRTKCGIDPGLRTFQTIYDNVGKVTEICTNYQKVIEPLLRRIDVANTKPVTRGLKRYKTRLYARIKNLTNDLHFKAANYIVRNYETVLIGNMSTRGIVQGNVLTDMNKRLLTSMSHYTFRMRLLAKCQQYECRFIEVNEAYTSKMCGQCRMIKQDLGAAKTYNCVACGYTADRDANAARNIYIKGLT